MKNWSTLGVTNVLLLIIAVFLLILVVNSSPKTARPSSRDNLSQMGSVPSPHDEAPMMNPHTQEGEMANNEVPSAPPASTAGFNFQNMAFAALKCPSDATVSLADMGCKGADAKKIRDYVGELTAQNLPPRMLFDKIIEKFGEGALTDEALEIRKNNRRQ